MSVRVCCLKGFIYTQRGGDTSIMRLLTLTHRSLGGCFDAAAAALLSSPLQQQQREGSRSKRPERDTLMSVQVHSL